MTQQNDYIPFLNRSICHIILGTTDLAFSNQSLSSNLLDTFYQLGGNCIDTALNYLDAELCIGNWMKLRQNRDEIVILTKGGHHNRERKRVTPKDIKQDLSESLKRLQTNYIDLYVLHRDDPDQPAGPILECLAEEVSDGRIKAFGASNWSVSRLEEAAEYTNKHSLPNFSISSPQFSLAFPNEPVWPNCLTARGKHNYTWYLKSNFPIFAWSPLGSGFFSNRFKHRQDMSEEERENSLNNPSEVQRVYYSENNFERLRRVNHLAKQKNIKSIQLALAWVLNQPLNIFAIVGAVTNEEIKELFDAISISLSEDELSWLNLGYSSP